MNDKDTAIVELAKREILNDIVVGVIPATVFCFGELHDYVDANGYGGLDDEVFNEGDIEADMGRANEIQGAVDAWIRCGFSDNPLGLDVPRTPEERVEFMDLVGDMMVLRTKFEEGKRNGL